MSLNIELHIFINTIKLFLSSLTTNKREKKTLFDEQNQTKYRPMSDDHHPTSNDDHHLISGWSHQNQNLLANLLLYFHSLQ
jgi:hypothetical protein